MAQGGMFGGGNVSPRMLMAQQLLAQGGSGAPVQHWTQGLNRLAQALVGARMAGMDSRDEQAAMAALGQGISAPQWVNPDTGTPEARASNVAGAPMVPTPQAGGYEGAIAALGGLQGNRMAQDLMSRLAMGKFESDIASKQKLQELMAQYGLDVAKSDRDRKLDFENQMNLAEKNNAAALERTRISSQNSVNPAALQVWRAYKELPSPELQQEFLRVLRADKVIDVGDRFVNVTPGMPGSAEDVAPKTLPPEKMPENIAAGAAAEVGGKAQGEAAVKLPEVLDQSAMAIKQIDDLLAHPGKGMATGASSVMGIQNIPGTEAKDFMARLKQVKGGAFLKAFETLKGGGQITELEGRTATEAMTRMDNSTSEAEFDAAAEELRGVLERGMGRALLKAGRTELPEQPASPPSAGGIKFLGFE